MRQRNLSGGMRNYYSFVVIDNNSGLEICRYEIPMPDDGVRFGKVLEVLIGMNNHQSCGSALKTTLSGLTPYVPQSPNKMDVNRSYAIESPIKCTAIAR